MVFFRLEPGLARWQAQTNPLSYGGTIILAMQFIPKHRLVLSNDATPQETETGQPPLAASTSSTPESDSGTSSSIEPLSSASQTTEIATSLAMAEATSLSADVAMTQQFTVSIEPQAAQTSQNQNQSSNDSNGNNFD